MYEVEVGHQASTITFTAKEDFRLSWNDVTEVEAIRKTDANQLCSTAARGEKNSAALSCSELSGGFIRGGGPPAWY